MSLANLRRKLDQVYCARCQRPVDKAQLIDRLDGRAWTIRFECHREGKEWLVTDRELDYLATAKNPPIWMRSQFAPKPWAEMTASERCNEQLDDAIRKGNVESPPGRRPPLPLVEPPSMIFSPPGIPNYS